MTSLHKKISLTLTKKKRMKVRKALMKDSFKLPLPVPATQVLSKMRPATMQRAPLTRMKLPCSATTKPQLL